MIPISKEEILRKRNISFGLHQDNSLDEVSEAMGEFAKQDAIEFFKWNAKQISEYLDYLRRVDKAEGISEKELELGKFENSTIDDRYNQYIKQL